MKCTIVACAGQKNEIASIRPTKTDFVKSINADFRMGQGMPMSVVDKLGFDKTEKKN